MSETIEIYGDTRSGNCYKLKLACHQLGVEYAWRPVDVMKGGTRTGSFLAMNANGKVPTVVLPDGRFLSESNAILSYLADGTPLAGRGRYGRADVLRWMFFEQYSHEPYIAVSRFIIKYLGRPPERQADLESREAGGYRALGVMEQQLDRHEFIAGDAYSIADIALYAYTHIAGEGDFDLDRYRAINDWLERVEAQPGYVPMA